MSNKAEILDAATVLLVREGKHTPEVLLLRRNKALRFASGFWVFPGGKVEDYEKEGRSAMEAAKQAAVREAWEETGIQIDANDLVFFTHWTTPKIEPLRFGTWFFYGLIRGEVSDVIVDGSEIEEHIWIPPNKALDLMHDNRLAMMPPTFMTLQQISHAVRMEDVEQALNSDKPPYILPEIVFQNEQIFCLYEGDVAYKSHRVMDKGPRHRLVSDLKFTSYEFHYKDCNHIRPVNGMR